MLRLPGPLWDTFPVVSRRMLASPTTWAWIGACLVLAASSTIAHGWAIFAFDFRPVYDGVEGLLRFGDPYRPVPSDLGFVYPPSCALLFLPVAMLPPHVASDAGLVLADLSMVALAWASGMSARPLRPWAGPACLALLALAPLGQNTLSLGNLSILVSALLAVSWLVWEDFSWPWTGILLGIALAIKPLVAPVVIIVILARRWKDLAVATGIAILLNLATLPLLRRPGDFITQVLPELLHGQTLQLRGNVAISAYFQRNSLPSWSADVCRIVLALIVLCVVFTARRVLDQRPVLIASASALVVTVALVSAQDEAHYSLVLVPLLVMGLVDGHWTHKGLAALAAAFLADSNHTSVVMAGQLTSLVVAGMVVRGALAAPAGAMTVRSPASSAR